ncbi:MAG TPA: phosphotransferase [Phycisphaerae bacterium]|nr:phosphotransferase [Phycisphaerae bacterium]
MTGRAAIEAVVGHFALSGELLAVEPCEGGHINESHLLTCRRSGGTVRLLLQRINDAVFSSPSLVMENIERVTAHLAQRLHAQGAADVDRRVLTLVPTDEGRPFHCDDAGSCWRIYRFIEGTHARQIVETPGQAEAAARAFGAFQRLLADFPGPRLHETIPGFHDTPKRFAALERAVETDRLNRAAEASAEIEFAFSRRSMASALLDLQGSGEIPERVVHNDAKVSNVLLDDSSGEALCVTDLDTVMPGTVLYDFGDMVRSMTSGAAEDEPNPSGVALRMPLFEALVRGYLDAAGPFLTAAERRHLVPAGKLITLEQGVRFLTDFLDGDTYYKTNRPGHNLDRCRTQLKLVESIVRREARMREFIERY